MFRFENPLFLLLLLLLPLLYFLSNKGKSSHLLRTTPFSFKADTPYFYLINNSLKYFIILCLIIAAANPQTGDKKSFFDSKGVNIIIAIDTSGSMRALDMKSSEMINRLDAVKSVVKDFIKKRSGDRIGIVVFGTNAFTLLPLTRDYKSIEYFIDRVQIGMAGENTAIGDAIAISSKRLKDIESKTNIIILLTDGESTSGEIPPLTAANAAKENYIKIYSIGIGSNGYAPFPSRDIFGRNVVRNFKVKLDEKTLKEISKITNGKYFNGKDKNELEDIYSKIDDLEVSTVKVENWIKDKDYYLHFLIFGLVLLLIKTFLSNTRFIKIP